MIRKGFGCPGPQNPYGSRGGPEGTLDGPSKRVYSKANRRDAGTTPGCLADALPLDRELTVVVNSPPLATALATRPNLTVIALGGRVRGRTLATVDDFALQLLSQVYVDVAFMATNGLTIERGLTTPDPAEAAVKRSMMAAARRTVLLADHTKVGNDYFARFGALADIDVLITDAGLNDSVADDIRQAGPRVVLA